MTMGKTVGFDQLIHGGASMRLRVLRAQAVVVLVGAPLLAGCTNPIEQARQEGYERGLEEGFENRFEEGKEEGEEEGKADAIECVRSEGGYAVDAADSCE
jgi:hypothetical protein